MGPPHPVPSSRQALTGPPVLPDWGSESGLCGVCCLHLLWSGGPTLGRMGTQRRTPAPCTIALASLTPPPGEGRDVLASEEAGSSHPDTSGQGCLPHARVSHMLNPPQARPGAELWA